MCFILGSRSVSKQRSRKIRNPKYAPEWLEKRLSPSALVDALPAVEVSPLVADQEDPPFPLPDDYPPSDPTLPPIVHPNPPVEPGLPD